MSVETGGVTAAAHTSVYLPDPPPTGAPVPKRKNW